MYKSVIRPLLEYATPVWNPILKKDIAEVESVQRRITKRIREVRGMAYPDRLRLLALPTLQQRRLYFDLTECYKVLHALDLCDCIRSLHRKTTNTRGHTYQLVPPKSTLLIRRQTFTHRVVNAWNALPAEIVTLPTIASFRRALRLHLRLEPNGSSVNLP